MFKYSNQLKEWNGQFGKEYTDRNPHSIEEVNTYYLKNFGITRNELNELFLEDLDRSIKILEVGSNVGTQLLILQKMGFENLYGIEPSNYAVELSKSTTKNINIIKGTAFDIPFKDDYFDLVFTAGVLIHINPTDITKAMGEIYRCTKKFIWGYEYYANEYTEIVYRGQKNLLWKADFAQNYMENFSNLELVKEKHLNYKDNNNINSMFLHRKKD